MGVAGGNRGKVPFTEKEIVLEGGPSCLNILVELVISTLNRFITQLARHIAFMVCNYGAFSGPEELLNDSEGPLDTNKKLDSSYEVTIISGQ